MRHSHFRHPKKPTLKRSLGLFETTFYGVGLILGAGIYVLIGRGAALAGNSVWLSFVFASIIAGLTGLTYCELASKIPKESSDYLYTKKAFNSKFFSFLIGWVLIFAGSVSAAAVALGFGEYFVKLTSLSFSYVPLIAGALIIILSLINFWGIKESVRLDVLFTFVEMAGLVLIIAIGLPFFGSVDYFSTPAGSLPMGLTGVAAAAALIFFAFIGFDEMPKLIEEVKKGYKTIPKALIYALIISTTLYVLVSISAVSVVPWQELKIAPLSSIVGMVWGQNGIILMSIIALFATLNTVLAILVGISRLTYGMAAIKSLPLKLAKIHPKRRTPYFSVFTIMAISLFFLLLGDISILASATDLGIFIVFIAVNLSLIALRYKDRNKKPMHRFRTPFNIGWFPVTALLGVIVTAFLMMHFETIIYVYEIGIVAAGAVLYVLLNRIGKN